MSLTHNGSYYFLVFKRLSKFVLDSVLTISTSVTIYFCLVVFGFFLRNEPLQGKKMQSRKVYSSKSFLSVEFK